MLPTPSTSHVNFDQIYEPAEDSFLFLDTLSSATETRFLRDHFPSSIPSPLVLEVGTGSGVVLAFVTAHAREIFGREDVMTMGFDVNAFACEATAKTVHVAVQDTRTSDTRTSDIQTPAQTSGAKAAVFLDSVTSDLTAALRFASIDVLIFNPPYVPTESLPPAPELPTGPPSDAFERDSHLLSLSYAGGIDGMETTNRLLEQLPFVLSDLGVAYILLCAQNRPDAVIARIRSWPGRWSADKVGTSGRKAGWEKLCVLRIYRARNPS